MKTMLFGVLNAILGGFVIRSIDIQCQKKKCRVDNGKCLRRYNHV